MLPILLILGFSTAIVVRLLRRRKRGHRAEDGHSGDLTAEARFHSSGFVGDHKDSRMLKVDRLDSAYSNIESLPADDDFSPHLPAWGQARACPPVPSRPPPTDPLQSEAGHRSVDPPNSHGNDLAAANVDLGAAGGTLCKQKCVVSRTFAQSMPDELKIGIGDRVIVHLLFDDGWCLGDNLDIAKHRVADGQSYARAGVLPQDCLSGLERNSYARGSISDMSVMASSWATAAEEPMVQVSCSEPGRQEILDGQDNLETLLAPASKPQRLSSLLCDRESDLMRELEFALAHV